MTTLALSIALLIPLTPHTPAEQRIWVDEWQEKVVENGVLSRSLVAEYVDFQLRHAPPSLVETRISSTPTHRGMGGDVEQWRGLVSSYFTEVDRALCIMNLESGGNPNAVNPSSGAAGLFQIMPLVWSSMFPGNLFNPEYNVSVAAQILQIQGWGAWSPWNRGMCR